MSMDGWWMVQTAAHMRGVRSQQQRCDKGEPSLKLNEQGHTVSMKPASALLSLVAQLMCLQTCCA